MQDYETFKSRMGDLAELIKSYPEALQERVFETFVQRWVLHGGHSVRDTALTQTVDANASPEPVSPAKPPRTRSGNKETFEISKDLNLKPDGKPSFQEFCSEKKPSTQIEFNSVAVYYITRVLGMKSASAADVYTCYKDVHRKVPGNLNQSLRDTSGSRYGYINASNLDEMTIPTRGENLVEHDLPKAGGKSNAATAA